MLPVELKAEQFDAYPPGIARQTALGNLALLRKLPPAFLPFLLKETLTLNWKFPPEQQDLLAQLSYLSKLPDADRAREMAPFASLRLSPALENFDFVNNPAQFIEHLSAHLWATSQMDAFRSASEHYLRNFRQAHPEPPPPVGRLAVVFVGQDVSASEYPLFRKLRREGTLFNRVVENAGSLPAAVETLRVRAAAGPSAYSHWFIDGGRTSLPAKSAVPYTSVSYEDLADVRSALNTRIRQAFESHLSPETLRTDLAALTPQSLGLKTVEADECMDRFKVALFTEGSGTQIYSTTFVQWTAREALRRAQPVTLMARYAPRHRETSMAELLSGKRLVPDPDGSLIDADMGAWYMWISLQRLTGADQSRFIAYFEGHNLAVAVGPAFPKGTVESKSIAFAELLQRA